MKRQSTPPVYEVEFIPLERRLKDRRTHQGQPYVGPERRREHSRRDGEQTPQSCALLKPH